MHPDEAKFLAAIQAGDDTARLVFADWLEERGDPRGPWVRDPDIWAHMAPDARNPVKRLLIAVDGDRLLPRLGPGAIPTLVGLLRDGNDMERRSALKGFRRMLLDPARQKLRSEEARREIQRLVGPHAAEVAQALGALLHDKTADRVEAVDLLFAVGREVASAAVPVLAAVLIDGNYDFRWFVANALAHDPLTADLVPALTVSLRDANARVRRDSAQALGSLAAEAVEAVPDLVAALRDGNEEVRLCVVYALERTGIGADPQAVEALVEAALGDESERVKWAAWRVLPVVDPGSTFTIAALNRTLLGRKKRWRAAAAEAIDTITANAGRAPGSAVESVPALATSVPALAATLRDDQLPTRLTAATTLCRLGASAAGAVPALVAAFGDRHEEMRLVAAWALSRIGAAAIPALAEALGDERTDARGAAALALEWIGSHDPDEGVRQAAEARLRSCPGAAELTRTGDSLDWPPFSLPEYEDYGPALEVPPTDAGDDTPGERPDRDVKGTGRPGQSRKTWWGGFQVTQLQKRRREEEAES